MLFLIIEGGQECLELSSNSLVVSLLRFGVTSLSEKNISLVRLLEGMVSLVRVVGPPTGDVDDVEEDTIEGEEGVDNILMIGSDNPESTFSFVEFDFFVGFSNEFSLTSSKLFFIV